MNQFETLGDIEAFCDRFDEEIGGTGKGHVDAFFKRHGLDPLVPLTLAVRHIKTVDVQIDDGGITLFLIAFAMGLQAADEAA